MLLVVACSQEQQNFEATLRPEALQPRGFFTEILLYFVLLMGVALAICELVVYCLQTTELSPPPSQYGTFNEEIASRGLSEEIVQGIASETLSGAESPFKSVVPLGTVDSGDSRR